MKKKSKAELKKRKSERMKLYRKENSEKIKEYSKRYQKKNREKINTYQRARANRDKTAWAREWRGRNPIKVALASSRSAAKSKGHVPCLATEKEISEAYDGKCHICGISSDACKTRLCLDHCHETGDFRGWLCNRCNKTLGLLEDSPGLLRLAIEYLEKGN